MVFNLRAKLDGAGHYDDFEVDRVVAVELDLNAKQSELVGALEPVRDRVLKRYQAAQAVLKLALEKQADKASKAAQDELDALILFKDQVNLTSGVYLQFPRLAIGGSVCVPLVGPRPYDLEAMFSMNYQF